MMLTFILLIHHFCEVVWNVIGKPNHLHLPPDKEKVTESVNTSDQVVYLASDKVTLHTAGPLVRADIDTHTIERQASESIDLHGQSHSEGLPERSNPSHSYKESVGSYRDNQIPRESSVTQLLNNPSELEVSWEYIESSLLPEASLTLDTDEPTIASLVSEIQDSTVQYQVHVTGGSSHTQEDTIEALDVGNTMASMQDVNVALQGLSLRPGGSTGTTPGAAQSRAARGLDSAIPDEVRRSCDYPFLQHQPTVDYVKQSQVMFVMRGLPGSGKSTVVKLLVETYPNSTCCSADDFFLQPDGSYRFNKDRLSDAHEACQQKAKAACTRGCPVVIIDNTNVKMWEMRNYTNLASEHNYTVVAVEPKTPWRKNPEQLAKRNKHGVPVDVLRKKVQSYDEGVPLYYGWFLNQAQSGQVMRLAEKCFKSCRKAFPAYQGLMNNMAKPGEKMTMQSIYGRTQSSTDTLHCTAFFANRGQVTTASAYHSQPHVKGALGHICTVEVVGFVFSPRTAGVRLRLDTDNLSLWGKDDAEGQRGASRSTRYAGRVTDSPRSGSSGNRWRALDGADKPSRFRPVLGDGSRAHLTIGYTKSSKAVETGLDLIQVVEHEQRVQGENEDRARGVVRLDGATLRCYGDQFWVVYLDNPCQVKTLFSGRY